MLGTCDDFTLNPDNILIREHSSILLESDQSSGSEHQYLSSYPLCFIVRDSLSARQLHGSSRDLAY